MRSLKVTLFLFALLTLTGLILMFYYVPDPTPAVTATRRHQDLSVGGLFRGVHFWAAQVVGVAYVLHLIFTAKRGHSQKRLFWASVLGLLLTLSLWFTGLLLPWDQLAYWLAETARKYGLSVTLMQVYLMHILFLPILTGIALFWYVRRFRKDEPPLTSNQAAA